MAVTKSNIDGILEDELRISVKCRRGISKNYIEILRSFVSLVSKRAPENLWTMTAIDGIYIDKPSDEISELHSNDVEFINISHSDLILLLSNMNHIHDLFLYLPDFKEDLPVIKDSREVGGRVFLAMIEVFDSASIEMYCSLGIDRIEFL